MEKIGKYNADKVFQRIYELSEDSHNIYTPFELCDEMLDKIPEVNSEMNILVMFNLEFIYKIRSRINNMDNVWFITPCEKKAAVAEGMGVNKNHTKFYSYKSNEIKDLESMPKFDVVVGNPPYMKNMHLKFLELAVNSLKKDGKVIWIHPARWLQDPLAPMKKGSDFLKYKDLPFQDFKIISTGDASNLFNNRMTSDLVISYLEKEKISILNEDKIYKLAGIPFFIKNIFNSSFISLENKSEKNRKDGIRVRLRPIVGMTRGEVSKHIYNIIAKSNEIIIDGLVGNIDWSENIQRNQFTKPKGSPIPISIKFDTIREARNFIDSTNTDFYTYLNFITKLDVNVQLKYLPFMGDYKEPWTNERFAEHFGVGNDEIEFIKETIKKFNLI